MLHDLLTGLTSISVRDAACIVILCSAFYVAILAISRLLLSPLSRFPGPKLAAFTWAYEFYYDWILPGKYYECVEQMHKKYGPIVRVAPDELHISEPSFYDEVYVTAATRRTDVQYHFAQGTGFHDIAVHARSHDEHRRNYVPLKSFFSRASITRLEGRTLDRLHRLDKRLQEWVDSGKIVNLSHAIYSYVTDIISSMLFEEASEYLGDPAFNDAWFEKLKWGMVNVPLFSFIPWLPRFISMPFMRSLFDMDGKWAVFDERRQRQKMARLERPTDPKPTRSGKTLFDEIVKDNPSKVSFSSDLTREVAQSVQQAAGHNLNRTLESTIALIAIDHERQKRLRESLRPIFEKTARPSWVELEKIPYLSACVTEGIRLIGGNLRRAARISPDYDIVYKDWKIPKNTAVSMTIYWMLMDPEVFPSPRSFIPERWLESSDAQLAEMNNFFVAFSKGSRACIGNHLTYMILHHTIAWLFRPGAPRIHLYETNLSQVLSSYGLFFSLARVDTPGIRAHLTTSNDG